MIFGFIGVMPGLFNISATFATQKVAGSRPVTNMRDSAASRIVGLKAGGSFAITITTESSPRLA
jgi:hypothetical protein